MKSAKTREKRGEEFRWQEGKFLQLFREDLQATQVQMSTSYFSTTSQKISLSQLNSEKCQLMSSRPADLAEILCMFP